MISVAIQSRSSSGEGLLPAPKRDGRMGRGFVFNKLTGAFSRSLNGWPGSRGTSQGVAPSERNAGVTVGEMTAGKVPHLFQVIHAHSFPFFPLAGTCMPTYDTDNAIHVGRFQ